MRKISAPVLILVSGVLVFIVFNLRDRVLQYRREVGDLEKRVAVILDSKMTLQQTLIKTIRENRQYKISIQDEVKRRELLNEQLQILTQEMSAARTEIVQLEQDKDFLKGQVSRFKKIRESLQLKIKRLLTRPKVELGEVVVTPSGLNGKILKANRLYNFVIIDLGKNDGIKPGMNLMAYREDDQIGEIVIDKVYDELSVGKAVFEWIGDEMDAGDTVSLLKEQG